MEAAAAAGDMVPAFLVSCEVCQRVGVFFNGEQVFARKDAQAMALLKGWRQVEQRWCCPEDAHTLSGPVLVPTRVKYLKLVKEQPHATQ